MDFPELVEASLEGRLRSLPLGEITQVHQERNGSVVALGKLGSDQRLDFAPGLGFLYGQLIEILAPSLGLLLLPLRLFLRLSLGGFSSSSPR